MRIVIVLIVLIALNALLDFLAPDVNFIIRGAFIGLVFGLGIVFGGVLNNG